MKHPPVILLVEDELARRKSICELLRDSGYTALAASSVADAIDALRQCTGPVALLIIHVDLGGQMSGTELAEHLRSLHPGVKVLMMVDSPEEARGLDDDIEYLCRPFAETNLTSKIDTMLAVEDELFRRDCGWIKQLLARRYPHLNIECEEDPGDHYRVKLGFTPDLLGKEVRFSEYLDGRWERKISSAVDRLDGG